MGSTERILTGKVIKVTAFQTYTIQGSELQWSADFWLAGGQRFHVRYNPSGYLYTPDSKHNELSKLKQIFWKRYQMGFGGRGCGLHTEVQLNKSASQDDQKIYEKILTPFEINDGRWWIPYPAYSYVPMLNTAFAIRYAWNQKKEFSTLLSRARQNLFDTLALRESTYDLRQYQ